MKIPKNSIVFIALIVIVIAFIVGAIFWYLDDGQEDENLQRTGIPELSEEPITYTSKLEALNNLEETKERTAPSIYQEYDKDSLNSRSPSSGINPSIPMQDSLLPNPPSYAQSSKRTEVGNSSVNHLNPSLTRSSDSFENHFNMKERALDHQLFFAAHSEKQLLQNTFTDSVIPAVVDGHQVVRSGYRLQLRLSEDCSINGHRYPKNTRLFGFVRFQPNRVLIDISRINHEPITLMAYDQNDGNAGIYIQNSFQAEASQEVIGDVVDDIQITGVPQVSGLQRIFRKNHRNIKVTISNNYKLLLKPSNI
ncbi:conjugative transposon protein TraM [Zunongwangia sp. SCSIO 43204]|uniref:conjugative transposon protein TraM n=1 Tax=Zunongwangia sp. SCSIO 43204 TaxID=2779359 RepID=UPI001CAA0239|nr:conjugative transposon protein TraM [Zunongwangia sp. SCSIO 43204]UAB84183.1 conjugative transposon protein TraM [Zunongwangia sp. SCSIO 43204]